MKGYAGSVITAVLALARSASADLSSQEHLHALAAAHNAQLSWMAAAEEEVRMQPAPLALRPAARALPARC